MRMCVILLSMGLAAGSMSAQTVTGSGTIGAIPIFTGSSAVGNSTIVTTTSGGVGIGATTANPYPSATLTLGMNGSGATALNMTNSIATGSSSIFLGDTATYTTSSGSSVAGVQYAIIAGGPDVSGSGGSGVHENTLTLTNGSSGVNSFLITPNGDVGIGHSITAHNLTGSGLVILGSNGNVGVGTISPAYALDVSGAVRASSGVVYADGTSQTTAWTGVLCGGDYAESVKAAGGKRSYEPGDVLVLADDAKGDVQKSSEAYSTMVAGIYATKPGVVGRRVSLGADTKDSNEVPMAMVGIVPTKVTAENGPIHRGDLLVSSSTSGYAMKGSDRTRLVGAVIGKAMGSLESGSGVIEVLVTLQ